jgi:uncharacterized integral membrane protein (TIGR00697 family)
MICGCPAKTRTIKTGGVSMSKRDLPALSPLFLVLSCFFVTSLLVSNLIAGKLADFYGMTLPAAVILFPLTYIFGDILTEVYGFKRARLIIWTGFGANLFMIAVFMITLALPYPHFWKGQAAFQSVLGLTPRMVLASVAGYFSGEFLNSMVLSHIKVLTSGRFLWMRTIGSTVVGEGMDTLLFISIAFTGLMPAAELGRMMLAQYLWKVMYEILVTPLTYAAVKWVKREERLDTFDAGVRYNPFAIWGFKHE